MEKETIYIYLIRDGKVVQDECRCEAKSKSTYKIYDKKRRMQTVSVTQLGVCERNRVVSFEDNLSKFKQIIITDLEKRVKLAETKLKQQKKVLNSIKKY